MDIVERLRDYACVDKTGWADMVLAAADEIERLRNAVQVKNRIIDETMDSNVKWKEQLATATKERDELAAWQQAAFDAHPNIDMDIEYALAKLGADKGES